MDSFLIPLPSVALIKVEFRGYWKNQRHTSPENKEFSNSFKAAEKVTAGK